MFRFVCIAIFVGILTWAGCARSEPELPGTGADRVETRANADPLATARQRIERRDYNAAASLIQQVLVDQPDNAAALELAADVAIARGQTDQAIEFCRLAVDASKQPSVALLDKLGQQYMNAGRPFDSLQTLHRAIEQSPRDPEVRQKLVGLQAALGMQRESAEHLQWLVQRGHGNVNLLVILSDLNRPQTVESTCQYALQHYPDDLRPQFSLACLPAYHGKWEEVAEKLKPVIERHSDFVPAHALYGRAVVELGDSAAIERWLESLPADIEGDPQYWMAVGILADRRNNSQRAAHAFWRAVLLNENDAEALSRWSTSLAAIGLSDESKRASARSGKITTLRDRVDSLLALRNNSQSAAVRIATILEELGRRWEATTWLQAAFAMNQNPDSDLTETFKSIRSRLSAETPWQAPEQLVAATVDLSDLPGAGDAPQGMDPESVVASGADDTRFRFTDQASQRGLNHVCALGKPTGEESGLAIYQSGAGGAGVIDYDLDGWPDVYLTSMDGDPRQDNSSPNRFFRNVAGQFANVTDHAGLGDRGFAQGIAVGDFNADGMPDVVVANIGRNRLFRNNGDGTFTDVTGEAGLGGIRWTTSAAIVDIDGDGHADLFEVGYCAGDNAYEQQCMDEELNEPRSCSPLAFDAQPDRVWRGNGDGTFSEATSDWLGAHEPGRGFGLVAGQLDGDGGLDIYVANDMTGNHYWSPGAENGDGFQLTEQATLRGLAVNERSLSQASMGMAAGDADSDGDVDFLLTHFSGDYNTFYEQVGPGMWADRSRRLGFAEPSDRMLGYGTQWIDAENDGSPELFVANGDIDDFTHENRHFRQPVQFFDRRGNGRWFEVDRKTIGEYFHRDHLARAVAVLDADWDGRTDLLVTHLFDPVALLVNETETRGKQIRFFLKATRSHRDAIGAQVSIEVDGRQLVGQLFAGDGFQCSNERCVIFGVGDAAHVDKVTITWPGGDVQELGSLTAGHDYLVVEGAGDGFAWQR